MFFFLAIIAGIWALYRVDARDWTQSGVLIAAALVFGVIAKMHPEDR